MDGRLQKKVNGGKKKLIYRYFHWDLGDSCPKKSLVYILCRVLHEDSLFLSDGKRVACYCLHYSRRFEILSLRGTP